MGVALAIGGCGQVSFGPLDPRDAGPDVGPGEPDAEPMDAIVYPDADPPDVPPPDMGPPIEGCLPTTAPTYPASFSEWPFASNQPAFQGAFWDGASFNSCNSTACHANGEDGVQSDSPRIPLDLTALMTDWMTSQTEVWDRIKVSDVNDRDGALIWSHFWDAESISEQNWNDVDGNGAVVWQGAIDFVQGLMEASQGCHTLRWLRKYEPMMCTGPVDPDAGPADCYCPEPIMAARTALDSSGINQSLCGPALP